MDYEPWGAIIGKPNHNGIGYTGHVMDGATGLTYMQQRYYDQSIGRFLSVDPVTAHEKPGQNFNRYWYANNNPYKFVDPDGRTAVCSGNSCEINCTSLLECSGDYLYVGTVITIRKVDNVINAIQEIADAADGDDSVIDDNEGGAEPAPTRGGTRTPAPFLPDDPYSPEETSRRQSGNRETEGAPSLDPDSPIPDRGAGSDQGGHEARGRTPHETGERNVNSNEEHSRRAKGNPSGNPRR